MCTYIYTSFATPKAHIRRVQLALVRSTRVGDFGGGDTNCHDLRIRRVPIPSVRSTRVSDYGGGDTTCHELWKETPLISVELRSFVVAYSTYIHYYPRFGELPLHGSAATPYLTHPISGHDFFFHLAVQRVGTVAILTHYCNSDSSWTIKFPKPYEFTRMRYYRLTFWVYWNSVVNPNRNLGCLISLRYSYRLSMGGAYDTDADCSRLLVGVRTLRRTRE